MSTLHSSTAAPLALTMGDPSGIGPDITLAAWTQKEEERLFPFFVIADPSVLEERAARLSWKHPIELIRTPKDAASLFPKALPVFPIPSAVSRSPGGQHEMSADLIIRSIDLGVAFVRSGQAAALITNPVYKKKLYKAGFSHPGHTEFLASRASQAGEPPLRAVMMLCSEELRVVPVTRHIPLREVARALNQEMICHTARITDDALVRFFGCTQPRLAVTGLNPHAGEEGTMGNEEITIIEPAIAELKREGLTVEGPFPADTIFHEDARKAYDVIIAMYHDQALIPLKTLAFERGVNITLGLPFIRTSPDHGTAYDLAGSGRANPQSLIHALRLGHDMSLHSTMEVSSE